MSSRELQVIFGAGPLGRALANSLLERGKRIRMVSRSGTADVPEQVILVAGDVTDFKQARALAEGASVVYNCLNAPYTEWENVFPRLQAGVIEAAAAAGAKLISAENVYMYGEVRQPMTEDMPYKAHTRKGRVRAKMAETLMQAHESGKVQVAIARASDFYGPGVLDSSAGERVFYPALEGKKVTMIGKLDVPHTLTYIADFGRALAILGEHDQAIGEIWHVPNAETLTARQFLTMIFEEAGHTPNFGTVPNFVIRAMGLFMPMMREVAEMLYEFDRPHIIDHSKFVRAFGDISTAHCEAIRHTLAWYRQHPKHTA